MKKMVIILFVGAAIFCAGSVVAYYNTSSFGYDNANIVTFKDDAVQVMDFEIAYEDIERFADNVRSFLPDEMVSISCK